VVKILTFLGLEPRLNIKYRFNWAGKIEHFSKVSFPFPWHRQAVVKNQVMFLLLEAE
jgi:hypothetical protein